MSKSIAGQCGSVPLNWRTTVSRRAFSIGALMLAATSLVGCSRSYRWRQKLTVTVATPSGDKSGSAVTEVKAKLTNSIGAGPGGAMGYRGEAAVVDLSEGRYLFALLSDQTSGYAEFVFKPADTESSEAFWGRIEASVGKVGSMPADRYPMLVTFGDLNDPKSVKEVKPSDLAASFGEGTVLKSITLEITDEPGTEGVVEKVLPWIGDPEVWDGSIWKSMSVESSRMLAGLFSDVRPVIERFKRSHN